MPTGIRTVRRVVSEKNCKVWSPGMKVRAFPPESVTDSSPNQIVAHPSRAESNYR